MKPAAAVLLGIIVFVTACGGPEGPAEPEPIPLPAATPEQGAEALFRLAAGIGDESFLPDDLVRDDLAEEYGTDLLDLLEPLAGFPAPRILGMELFPDSDRAAVDVEFDLPGEGLATWSVQLEQGQDDGWRLVWIQGPGAGWPPRKTRGDGLSSSDQGGSR